MTRLLFGFCFCLLLPARPVPISTPAVWPICFPLPFAANHRTEYFIDGEEVEKDDALERRDALRIVEVRYDGGWIRVIRFEVKK